MSAPQRVHVFVDDERAFMRPYGAAVPEDDSNSAPPSAAAILVAVGVLALGALIWAIALTH